MVDEFVWGIRSIAWKCRTSMKDEEQPTIAYRLSLRQTASVIAMVTKNWTLVQLWTGSGNEMRRADDPS